MTPRIAPALASMLLAVGVFTACGGDDKAGAKELELKAKTGERVPAGAETGVFRVLPAAPKSYRELKGSATLTRSTSGTKVRVELSGLNPGTELEGHVHEKPCAQDEGGDHYQFVKGGEEEPPNEIHVELKAGTDGSATATGENPGIAGPLALSVVVHDATRGGKVACADLT